MNVRKLKSVMAERGVTQIELAKVLGVSENTLSRKFVGRSSFDVEQVNKICDYLAITDSCEKAIIFLS